MQYEVATTPTDGAMPGMSALAMVCVEKYGVGTYGIYSNRKIRGKNTLSVHAEGRAWDAKCSPDNPVCDRMAEDLWKHSEELGIQKIVWNHKYIDCETNEWKDYKGLNPHTNHLHIEMTREKANTLRKKDIWECLK